MIDTQARRALEPLLGLKLSIARNAGNMKGFHFGDPQRVDNGLVGQYALHVHCPWRIEGEKRVLTGSGDCYVRANSNDDLAWEAGMFQGHLQDEVLHKLLRGYDEPTRSIINITDELVVVSIDVDGFGGFSIDLSGGHRLVIFPVSGTTEAWRLLQPNNETAKHVVVEGSTVFFD